MEIMSLWKSIGIRERVLGNEIKKFFLKLPCIASSRKAFNGAKKTFDAPIAMFRTRRRIILFNITTLHDVGMSGLLEVSLNFYLSTNFACKSLVFDLKRSIPKLTLCTF